MTITCTQAFFAAVIAALVIGAWYLVDAAVFWAVFMLIFAGKLGSDRDLWRLLSKKTKVSALERHVKQTEIYTALRKQTGIDS